MYVAVKGGEQAISAAHDLLAEARRGDPSVAGLPLPQIEQQLALAVGRVMTEGSIYDRELAALAIKQARGDLVEAIFLVRAYRTTLPRLATTLPIDTGSATLRRRISATYKDLPGGQILGPTFDYTHRLLDFALAADSESAAVGPTPAPAPPIDAKLPRVTELLDEEGLIERNLQSDATPADITREPLEFPAERAVRLQNLARGDAGFPLALAYSSQRGYANNHPFAGEIRVGADAIEITPPVLDFTVLICAI